MPSRPFRLVTWVVALTMLGLVLGAPVAARGPDPDRLQQHGWVCFDIPPIGLHCDNPGLARRTATEEQWLAVASWPELVFDSASGAFLGTEVGIRDDLWHPRPCPRDQGQWIADVGHRFCHHYDSP